MFVYTCYGVNVHNAGGTVACKLDRDLGDAVVPSRRNMHSKMPENKRKHQVDVYAPDP